MACFVGSILIAVVFTGWIVLEVQRMNLSFREAGRQTRAVLELSLARRELDRFSAAHDGRVPAVDTVPLLNAALGAHPAIPPLDPWGNSFVYVCWPEPSITSGCSHYRIASAGSDGRLDGDLRLLRPGTFSSFGAWKHDIVLGDQGFSMVPSELPKGFME